MCENNTDLGEQEPKGCRFVHGDPGSGIWFYCQAPIVKGGKAGDVNNPPYCRLHRDICIQPSKPFKFYGKWATMLAAPNRAIAPDDARFDHTIATDVYMHLNNRGLIHD